MKGQTIPYTSTELAWIKRNKTMTRAELHASFCQHFKRTDVSTTNLIALRKRKGWLTGRTGQFKLGNIPSPNARPKGPNKTSFKAGQAAHNQRAIGARRTSKDGYIEVKTKEPATWEHLHIVLWRAKHGNIPPGHCITFKNGDKTDVSMANLELLTRNENLQINRFSRISHHPETQQATRTLGKLAARISAAEHT